VLGAGYWVRTEYWILHQVLSTEYPVLATVSTAGPVQPACWREISRMSLGISLFGAGMTTSVGLHAAAACAAMRQKKVYCSHFNGLGFDAPLLAVVGSPATKTKCGNHLRLLGNTRDIARRQLPVSTPIPLRMWSFV
jgi:hypothetical protein